jgi:hypothetical protein
MASLFNYHRYPSATPSILLQAQQKKIISFTSFHNKITNDGHWLNANPTDETELRSYFTGSGAEISGYPSGIMQDHPGNTRSQSKIGRDQPEIARHHTELVQGHVKITGGLAKLTQGHSEMVQGHIKIAQGLSETIQGHPKMAQGLPEAIQGHPKTAQGLPAMIQS